MQGPRASKFATTWGAGDRSYVYVVTIRLPWNLRRLLRRVLYHSAAVSVATIRRGGNAYLFVLPERTDYGSQSNLAYQDPVPARPPAVEVELVTREV
jgi:hypothetical protein